MSFTVVTSATALSGSCLTRRLKAFQQQKCICLQPAAAKPPDDTLKCPQWVKSGGSYRAERCPVCPHELTYRWSLPYSARGQQRTRRSFPVNSNPGATES